MTPQKFERREAIRVTYKQLPSPDVDLYFAVCKPPTKELETLALAEKLAYKDMLVLDCEENMDDGKTYTYFSTVAKLFCKEKYDYVMKADDDSWLGLQNLGQAIQNLPSRGLGYGRTNQHFHLGMGYIASWDIIHWISTHDEQVKQHLEGPEDLMFYTWARMSGRWARMSSLVKHYIHNDVDFYDVPGSGGGWTKNYNHDTQLIHLLKDSKFFFEAAEYFLRERLQNVTLISSKGRV